MKNKVVAQLKQLGVYYFFPTTFGMGRSGVPDIICCVDGLFLGIECKAGSNKPTPLQIREIEAIRMAGGMAVIVNETNIEMVRPLILKMKEQKGASGAIS